MTVAGGIDVRSFSALYIGGSWVAPQGDGVIEIVSPVTEEVVATVPDGVAADVDRAVKAARDAFDHGPWPRMTPAERGDALGRVAKQVSARVDAMAASFTAEIGAPRGLSKAFQEMAVALWDDASTMHERFVFEDERSWPGGSGTVVREPVGVVGTIIPWNGPVATATLKIAPALAAGCTVVLKPAELGPVSVFLLAEAIEAAGLPPGVVNIVSAGREAGEHLVRHPDVDKVAFTGSTAVGRRIMGICADRIARVNLELGGKSAGIVADDIAVEDVVPALVGAGLGNSGQVCAAITRILVPRERHGEFTAALASAFEAMTVGDPRDPGTDLGPLASAAQRDRVEQYIELGRKEGATLVTGGGRPAGLDRGYFVEPTLFADVENSMAIAREEIFGPVVCVLPYDDLDAAIAIANDSDYGLSGAVFARDVDLARSVARRIRTGQVSINGWGMCVFAPFGGYKQSGLGRDGGTEGMAEYLEAKVIQDPA